MSIFDVFSHFTGVLRAWFDNWLAIPVCSYFFIPQPTATQLIHATMMLTLWSRLAGPSAIKPRRGGNTVFQKDITAPPQPVAAFSGVRTCPDLSLCQPFTPASAPSVEFQTLKTLRAQILAQHSLHIDIFGTLDAVAVRLGSARKEMAAAHGGAWKNDIWDHAAEMMKIKKGKVEKWCEIVDVLSSETGTRLTDASNGVDEWSGEIMNFMQQRGIDGFDWLTSNNSQEDGQWENDLFAEILSDIHAPVLLDPSGGWDTDILDDTGAMGGQIIEYDMN